jgi:hypothetical protein
MTIRSPKTAFPLLATLAALALLLVCGGASVHQVLLGLLLVAAVALTVAALPIVGFALLLRIIRGPLDAQPEIRLVPRVARGAGDFGAGSLERRPAAV